MSNGTQNIFVTKTKNRFLPIIQAFTDNMYKHMEAQGNLAEKMYAFNKKQQGEQFISNFGTRLRGATTPEELNTIMGEASQYAGSRGLTPHLSVLGTVAQTQGSLIKLEQDKEQADITSNVYISSFGKELVTYKGEETKVSSAIQDINNMTTDPTTRLGLMQQVIKGIYQTKTNIGYEDNKFTQYTSKVNPVTGEEITTGEPVDIAKVGDRYILDENRNRIHDEGEQFASPDEVAKISQIKLREEEQRKADARTYARLSGLSTVTIQDKETGETRNALMDHKSRLFEIENGVQGELITDRERYLIVSKSTTTSADKQVRLGELPQREDRLKTISKEISSKLRSDSGLIGRETDKKRGVIHGMTSSYFENWRTEEVMREIIRKQKAGEELESDEEDVITKPEGGGSSAFDVFTTKYLPAKVAMIDKYEEVHGSYPGKEEELRGFEDYINLGDKKEGADVPKGVVFQLEDGGWGYWSEMEGKTKIYTSSYLAQKGLNYELAKDDSDFWNPLRRK